MLGKLFRKKDEKGPPQGPQLAPYQCPFPLTGEIVTDAASPEWIYVTPTQADFLKFRSLADTMEDFALRVSKPNILVWDKKVKGEAMVMIKAFTTLDCTPECLWNMLHDPEYRIAWDESRLDAYLVAQLSPNCDIGYYAAKAQSPVFNRDFLNQRAWCSAGNGEYVIFNTSVPHAKCPEQKGFVRAVSKIAGYLVRPFGESGCSLTYLSSADPKGWIPSAFVNMLVSKFSPAMLEKIRKASLTYPQWLEEQGHRWKKTWSQEAIPWPCSQPNATPAFFLERQAKAAQGVASPVVEMPEPSHEEELGGTE